MIIHFIMRMYRFVIAMILVGNIIMIKFVLS